MRPHLLIIAQSFPPIAGVAAYRPMRLANAMVQRGWDVSVACAPPMDLVYRWGDPQLTQYVGSAVNIYTIPDSQTPYMPRHDWTDQPRRYWALGKRILRWLGGSARIALLRPDVFTAMRTLVRNDRYPRMRMDYAWCGRVAILAEELNQTHPITVVLATMPPFYAAVAARVAADGCRVPYVLDYRDTWEGNTFQAAAPNQHELEQELLDGAAAVIGVTEGISQALTARTATPVATVSNGFDPRMYPQPREGAPAEDGGPLRIVQAGTLYPGSGFTDLVAAVAKMPAETATLDAYGDVGHEVSSAMAASPDHVRYHGFVPSAVAKQAVCDADVAVVMEIPFEVPTTPSKTFEYLATRTPVIFIGSRDHETARLLDRAGLLVGAHRGESELSTLVAMLAAKKRSGTPLAEPNEDAIAQYGPDALGDRFAAVLGSAAGSTPIL